MDGGSKEAAPLLRQRAQPPRKTSTTTVLGVFAALLLVVFFNRHPLDPAALLSQDSQDSREEPQPTWSWTNVNVSRELRWEQCYDDKFECARLDVPMDWLDPTEEQRVVLGVIKLPAKSESGKFSPVFVNPGGPGGSGISFVRQAGPWLQTIVGDNHDIISFDPRGVGVSTPRVDCWRSIQKRRLWELQSTPVIDERPGLVHDALARAMAYASTCEAAMNDTGILEHLSTPSHARDMLEILDKTGHAKLRYWGFSYGSILGGVFAGLFPDRVERLVSDGNCDYHDWFKLDHVNFLSDTDRIFDEFDAACHKVGPEKCAFWADSPSAIQARRNALLESLKKSPVVVPAGPDQLPHLVTYSAIQRITQTSLYKPVAFFPQLAAVWAALEVGDGQPYMDMAAGDADPASSDGFCSIGETDPRIPFEKGGEEDAFPAIMCSDNEPWAESVEDVERYAERLFAVSQWAGAVNTPFHIPCAGRKVRPKWRFTEDDFHSDTAFPILYIGNLADNVTPLQSAHNNSARFPTSVVLQQNSYGHCSLASPSTCTVRHIRAYFQEGVLPPAGSECDSDYGLFEMPELGGEAEAAEKDELASAALRLAREVDIRLW